MRLAYYVNIALILLFLLACLQAGIMNWEDSDSSFQDRLILVSSLCYSLFAWPFFATFLALSIWMALKGSKRRNLHFVVSTLFAVLLVLTLPSVFKWYFSGMPMP